MREARAKSGSQNRISSSPSEQQLDGVFRHPIKSFLKTCTILPKPALSQNIPEFVPKRTCSGGTFPYAPYEDIHRFGKSIRILGASSCVPYEDIHRFWESIRTYRATIWKAFQKTHFHEMIHVKAAFGHEWSAFLHKRRKAGVRIPSGRCFTSAFRPDEIHCLRRLSGEKSFRPLSLKDFFPL